MSLPNLPTISTRSKLSLAGVGILSIALLLTVTLSQTRQENRSKAAAASTFGTTSVGTSYDTGNSYGLTCNRYLSSVSGTLTSASAYVGAVDATRKSYYMGIYADTNGNPGSLIAKSGTGTLSPYTWNTIALTGNVSANQYYWICYNSNTYEVSQNNMAVFDGTEKAVWLDQNPGSWPTTFGTPGSTWTQKYSMYATVSTTPIGQVTGLTQKLVQQNFLSQGGTSKSVMLPASVTSGNLLVVPVSWYQGTITGISDNRGNNYSPVTSIRCAYGGVTDCVQLYYVKNALPGQTTVTVTFSESTDNNLGIYEYAGYDKVSPLDKVAGATGYSSAPNGGILSSSNNNELYFAVGVDNDGNNTTITAGSGYSLRHSTLDAANNERFYAEDRIAAAGSYSSNFAISGDSSWAVIGAAFKPEIAAPTATTTPLPIATPLPTAIPATATPLPTATPTPKPTATPTPKPLATATPYPTSTPYPTAIPATATPFPTAIPSPTPFVPTNTPVPTETPMPGNTYLTVNVLLHGIGKGGDSVTPNSVGNLYPLHPSRTVTVDVYDVQNQLVRTEQGTVVYNLGAGNFVGNVDLGAQFATGIYTVKVKVNQYLRGIVGGIQTITQGKTTTLPTSTLVSGDINNDNQINIQDYNVLLGCYSDLLPATDCNDLTKVQSDLNDDGNVNQFDYNLFVRELTNIGGQ